MLETTDSVKLAASGRGLYEAPAIPVEYFVEADDSIRVRINFSETADSGVVDSIDVRYTEAEMNAINSGYSAAVAALSAIANEAAKAYLLGVNPSATIDIVT